MGIDLITVKGIRFCYYHLEWVLKNISLSLSKGEIVSIIGPNGSGKSTLLKLIAGIVKPQTGTIYINKQPIHSITRRNLALVLGYLPQNTESDFDYSAKEVVGLGRFPHLKGIGFLSRNDHEVVTRCLEATDILHLRDRTLSTLSGGEKKRVLLASVLAQEPEILLLDEPTASLDIHHQIRFYSLLRRLATEGLGIMVVTHDINLASVFSSRLLVLNKGRIIMEGTPQKVIKEDVMRSVYGNSLCITKHPQGEIPLVFPARE